MRLSGRAPRRRTLRTRLTLLYATSVVLVGSVLVAVTYGFVAATVDAQPLDTVAIALSDTESSSTDSTGSTAGADSDVDEDPAPGEWVNGTRLSLDEVSVAVSSVNRETRDATLASLLRLSVVTLLVTVSLAAAVGWVVASRAIRPLQQITAAARRVADDTLHRRLAMTGPRDEITELADTFDEMLGRLDTSFDAQRRFVAHASHELRTPLAITRTVIEVTLGDPDVPDETRRLGERLLMVNERHERLIEGLLALATAEGATLQTEQTDLAEAARAALASTAPEITAQQVQVELALEPAPLVGDPVLLERLVHNLVENAVRYNDRGGFVRVETRSEEGSATVTVTNSGALVPGEAVDSLLEPFRRFGRNGTATDRREGYLRGGAGLGLAVVRAVAETHAGSVAVRARPHGGLVVQVRLAGAGHASRAPARIDSTSRLTPP